jgi:hypothetical protein
MKVLKTCSIQVLGLCLLCGVLIVVPPARAGEYRASGGLIDNLYLRASDTGIMRMMTVWQPKYVPSEAVQYYLFGLCERLDKNGDPKGRHVVTFRDIRFTQLSEEGELGRILRTNALRRRMKDGTSGWLERRLNGLREMAAADYVLLELGVKLGGKIPAGNSIFCAVEVMEWIASQAESEAELEAAADEALSRTLGERARRQQR